MAKKSAVVISEKASKPPVETEEQRTDRLMAALCSPMFHGRVVHISGKYRRPMHPTIVTVAESKGVLTLTADPQSASSTFRRTDQFAIVFAHDGLVVHDQKANGACWMIPLSKEEMESLAPPVAEEEPEPVEQASPARPRKPRARRKPATATSADKAL